MSNFESGANGSVHAAIVQIILLSNPNLFGSVPNAPSDLIFSWPFLKWHPSFLPPPSLFEE
jgi:hypothetical protein